jgi:hypothetical protein
MLRLMVGNVRRLVASEKDLLVWLHTIEETSTVEKIPQLAENVLEAMLANGVQDAEIQTLRQASKKAKSEQANKRRENILKVITPSSPSSSSLLLLRTSFLSFLFFFFVFFGCCCCCCFFHSLLSHWY